MPTLTFDYRPGAMPSLFLLIVSALLSTGLGWSAIENNTQMEIFGMVLSLRASTIFFWVGAALFGLATLAGAKMLLQSFAKPRQVVLTDAAITAPKGGMYRTLSTIALADVTRFRVWSISTTTVLEVNAGKQALRIPKSYIRPAAEFDALAAAVQTRITAVRING